MSPNSSKPLFIIGSLLLLGLSVAAIIPEMADYREALPYSSIGLAFLMLIFAIVLKTKTPAAEDKNAAITEETPPEKPTTPETTLPDLNAVPEQSGEVQVAQLLAVLQEKGRFIDFAMGDITSYSDAQVAAAARFVHQGCQNVMRSNFSIESISTVAENAPISLDGEFDRNEFRLTGKVGDNAPFNGTLVHKGWKTTSISLPKVTGPRAAAVGTHVLAPAEVEIK